MVSLLVIPKVIVLVAEDIIILASILANLHVKLHVLRKGTAMHTNTMPQQVIVFVNNVFQ